MSKITIWTIYISTIHLILKTANKKIKLIKRNKKYIYRQFKLKSKSISKLKLKWKGNSYKDNETNGWKFLNWWTYDGLETDPCAGVITATNISVIRFQRIAVFLPIVYAKWLNIFQVFDKTLIGDELRTFAILCMMISTIRIKYPLTVCRHI